MALGSSRRQRVASALAALVVAGAAAVLLLGWIGGIEATTTLAIAPAAMVPSTALCFILLALPLALARRLGKRANTLSQGAAVAVIAIAAIDLVVILSGQANGIDTVLFPGLGERLEHVSMSVATAASFILAGVSALVMSDPWARRIFVPLASLGLLLPLIALIGYAFDTTALLSVFIFTSMAIHTAALFALLFFAMLLRAGGGWVAVLLDEGVGSAGARRLFLAVVLGPFLLCLVALAATRAGYFDANFRLTLLAIAMMLLGLVAILRNAVVENRAEQQQRLALDELQRTFADLEQTLADKNLLIREIHHRVKNNLQQITALIAIESAKYRDPELRAPFDALSGRIQALGLVHQLLMQSSRPSEIDVRTFFEDLSDSIRRSHYLARRSIALSAQAETEHVPLDASITLGLLANELIVNAIKHAFADSGGTIRVIYETDPGDPEARRLIVRDDGCGIDVEAAIHSEAGGGTRIVRSLVAQLRGKIDMDLKGGTQVVITFPASTFSENRYVAA